MHSILKSRIRKNFDFLFPGIAKCGVCGYAFCAERQKGKHVYYRCSHYDRSCTNTDYISEKEFTQSLRMHIKRIGLTPELYELVRISLKECLGDEQEYHKNETERINNEIEQCKDVLKKMYLDQVNNVLDYNLWINLKNEHETKLNRLHAELQKHALCNTKFLDNGLKILDVCKKASLPASELTAIEVAQIVRETFSKATITNRRVKLEFKPQYAYIEELVKLAKKGIAEMGMAKFKQIIISRKNECLESIKKEPEGSDFDCSICFKWWRIGDSNS
ncbi:zinc ribbon domain-containing protein [bacterium]|nr:zinc ribbon domain-containing protein [bacterium]